MAQIYDIEYIFEAWVDGLEHLIAHLAPLDGEHKQRQSQQELETTGERSEFNFSTGWFWYFSSSHAMVFF